MGRFGNEYLAESVGYANGHANGMADGVAVGREHGYTQGWNEATIHANGVIDERNQLIDRLYGANERLGAENRRLIPENEILRAENEQLKQQLQLQQEQVQALRAECEAMFKAFLGVVSIARPAMKAVAKLPLKERGQIYYEYGDEAAKLQSVEYVKANRFPGNQPLIQKYLPIAQQVFRQTHEQLQQQEAESKPTTKDPTDN